ncbi:hypothetical protein Avbf_15724 [Armadillidium vulgare]|nr:hypothetical protein Avbf_15724 [Armadillidium vulgare]
MQMTSITNRINERSTPKDVLTNNEHRSNAVAFNFDELKHHCVAGGNMKAFLKIENTDNRTSRLIVIDAFDSEFISLCSGEFGASYKNCKSRERKNKVSYSSIVAYNILTIEGSPQTNKHPSLVDYPEDTNHFILSYEIGDIFVEKEPGGLIRFFQVCEEMSIGNPDGRVIEPKNLNGFFLPKQNSPNKSKEKNFKVTDCGILFDCK